MTGVRGRLSMRALIERDTSSGTDAHGLPVKPVFTALATLPCFVYSRRRIEVVDGEKSAMVEDLRAIFALGADLNEGDEISDVQDRLGVSTLSGRFQVEAIQRKHTHIEVGLLRVQ